VFNHCVKSAQFEREDCAMYTELLLPLSELFNNQQEVAMITQLSNLEKHFHVESETSYILVDIHIETFIKTKLTKEQSMLLGLLVTERLPITEIAKYMKTSRMTVYRKIEELKTLWLEYETGEMTK